MSAAAQHNLGFELGAADGAPMGWSMFGPEDAEAVRLELDAAVTVAGERSLRIERDAAAEGATRLAQRWRSADLVEWLVGADRARIRISGSIRGAPMASLWLRVAGERGVLYLDSHGDGREHDERPGESGAVMSSPLEWRRFTLELPLPHDADEVAYGVALRGAGTAWFDDLEVRVASTVELPPPSAAARRYVEAALALMREHALAVPQDGWQALQAAALEYARGAVTPADAHLAVRYAVHALGDRHSYLQSPRAAGALRAAAVSNARTGQAVVPPWSALLDGRVGFLGVAGFAGGGVEQQVDFAESIKNLIQDIDVQNVCGWVVDLRRNTGGNLWPMLAGIGPLLGDGEVAASVYPDGRRVPVWYRDGQAGFGDYVQLRVTMRYRLSGATLPPVAILIGPRTASSGEVLATAFQGRPRSRTFGAPTRGLSAGNRTFSLVDGAALVLTVAATSDRMGRLYPGPLVPDEPVAASSRAASAGDDSVDRVAAAALAWLETQDACRAARMATAPPPSNEDLPR